MAHSLKAYIKELKEILEDIKANEYVNPYENDNGFSDNYSLQNEIEYFKEIERKLDEPKEVKVVENIINKNGKKITEDEFVRLVRKDGHLAQIFQDLRNTIVEIGRQGKRIQAYANSVDKIKESTEARYDAIKHIHIWLVKRLIAISQSIDEFREEIAD